MLVAFSAFLAAGAVLVLAGVHLARAADAIAERTTLGRAWVGAVLLAGATSLPELFTDLSAVRQGNPNLAAGDLFGSGLANMLLLALADLAGGRRGILGSAVADHTLTASLAMLLTALAAAFVLARGEATVSGVSPEAVVLGVVYLLGSRAMAGRSKLDATPPSSPAPGGLARPVARFALAGLATALAAPAFAWAAAGLAELTGLGNTFVGTWIVGLATSLPEAVSTIAAVRMGAIDLAIGNLFGSNAFNMLLFLPLDAAHGGGSIFAALEPAHALSALFSIVMMALGLAAVSWRSERRLSLVEPGSIVMIVAWFACLAMVWRHGGG